MKRGRVISLVLVALSAIVGMHAAAPSGAEVIRPVNSSYMFEVGSSHMLDTYLSPLKYTGWDVALAYERTQAMKFNPEKWRQQLTLRAEFWDAKNPAGNATMYYIGARAGWGMMHVLRIPCGFSLAVGGAAAGNLGSVYSMRNGNNPASLRADLTLNLSAYFAWQGRVGRMPVVLRWQRLMPLVGAFFSPEYDELYYEIYLGNHRGLAHVAWPGNMFRWDNLVTADLNFGGTSLRLGFRSDVYSTKVNYITTRMFTWNFVIGATIDWLSLSPRRIPNFNNAQIIRAY